MGSTPIARSILRQRQATLGNLAATKAMIAWEHLGKQLRIQAKVVASHSRRLRQNSHAASHLALGRGSAHHFGPETALRGGREGWLLTQSIPFRTAALRQASEDSERLGSAVTSVQSRMTSSSGHHAGFHRTRVKTHCTAGEQDLAGLRVTRARCSAGYGSTLAVGRVQAAGAGTFILGFKA